MDSKYDVYLKWLSKEGARLSSKVEYPCLFEKPFSVGAKAKECIRGGEALLIVPWHLVISSKSVLEGELRYLFNKHSELGTEGVLALTVFLTVEYFKGADSFYRPYLDCIVSDTPVMWSTEELERVQLVDKMRQLREDLHFYFKFAKKALETEGFAASKCDFDTFLLFYSFVLSRNFAFGENECLLIPLADALDHANVNIKYELYNSETFVFSSEEFDNDEVSPSSTAFINLDNTTGSYFCLSTGSNQVFEQGKQVYSSYGRKTNKQLLKWYGFCLNFNIFDSFSFNISFEGETAEDLVKKGLCDQNGVHKVKLTHCSAPRKFLALCRVFGADWLSKAESFLEQMFKIREGDKHEEEANKLETAENRELSILQFRVTQREILLTNLKALRKVKENRIESELEKDFALALRELE